MNNINTKIRLYQDKLSYKLSGVVISSVLKDMLGKEPTVEQVAYISVLLKISERKEHDGEDTLYLQIPVQYLFSSITPFNAEDYKKKTFQFYMSSVTKNTIEPLQDIVSVTKYDKSYCRRFMISKQFTTNLSNKEFDIMKSSSKLPPIEFIKTNTKLGYKPAKWGGYSLPISKLPPITKSAWEKLKHSRFRFDVNLFESYKGREFNSSLNLDARQTRALISAMDDIVWTNSPQYHDSFFIQQPGRLHTKGGPMAMTTPFRRYYVKPINPDNICLEVDLKCAQLLILCDVLQASEVKAEILKIIKDDSIWKYIGSPNLHKSVKKVIVYGFCFGARMFELPYLATQKAKKKYNMNIAVTSQMVNACFSGILKPLVKLRDDWMSDYSLSNIKDNKLEKLVYTNSLGLFIDLAKEASDYKSTNKGKLNNLKTGARLLAHYAQGYEQLIIQRLITDCIDNNILTYSYDGLTIEIENSEVKLLQSKLSNYIESKFQDYSLEFTTY